MGKIIKRTMDKDFLLHKIEDIRRALYTIRSNIPDKTSFIHQIDKVKIDKLHRNYELMLRTVDYFEKRVKSESGVSDEQLQILRYLKKNSGERTEVIGRNVIFNKLVKMNIKIIGSNLTYLKKQGYVTSKYEVYSTYDEKDPNRQIVRRVYYWTLTRKGEKAI